MPKAVLVHTVRGGKDPDSNWCIITGELADILPDEDIWRELGNYIDAKDSRVIASFLDTKKKAIDPAKAAGYTVEKDVWEAIGY